MTQLLVVAPDLPVTQDLLQRRVIALQAACANAPKVSYKMKATGCDYPHVVAEFMQSSKQTFRTPAGMYGGINYARRDAAKWSRAGGKLTAVASGTGRNAYVALTKHDVDFTKRKQAYESARTELARLLPQLRAAPAALAAEAAPAAAAAAGAAAASAAAAVPPSAEQGPAAPAGSGQVPAAAAAAAPATKEPAAAAAAAPGAAPGSGKRPAPGVLQERGQVPAAGNGGAASTPKRARASGAPSQPSACVDLCSP